MKVWIVEGNDNGESHWNVGVFSTSARAEECRDKWEEYTRKQNREHYEFYSITKYELNNSKYYYPKEGG